jgi:hypothetical protein
LRGRKCANPLLPPSHSSLLSFGTTKYDKGKEKSRNGERKRKKNITKRGNKKSVKYI